MIHDGFLKSSESREIILIRFENGQQSCKVNVCDNVMVAGTGVLLFRSLFFLVGAHAALLPAL